MVFIVVFFTDRLRVDRRAGAAGDYQRRAAEAEFVDTVLVAILGDLVRFHLDAPGVGADRGISEVMRSSQETIDFATELARSALHEVSYCTDFSDADKEKSVRGFDGRCPRSAKHEIAGCVLHRIFLPKFS
jgi:hypothetical protein